MPFKTEYRTSCGNFIDYVYGDSIEENHILIKNKELGDILLDVEMSDEDININLARYAGQLDNRKDKYKHSKTIEAYLKENYGKH